METNTAKPDGACTPRGLIMDILQFISSVAGVAFYSLIPINGTVAPPDWILGILFGAGGLLGMYFGAKMQKYISEKWIKLVLGIIVFIIASRYILRFFNY